jgi:hypothetical protein
MIGATNDDESGFGLRLIRHDAEAAREESPMKSKNPSKRRAPRGAPASASRADSGGRAIILDFVLHKIEAFNRELGGGVLARKDRAGYTLMRDDTGAPIARLRPKDTKGNFEVLYWSPDTERWRTVGLFGGTILPLHEALDFIASDPMDCFWK